MRWLAVLLATVLLALQWPLWFGKSNPAQIRSLEKDLAEARQKLADQQKSNLALRSEVNDLKDGVEALEERARLEYNMVKPNEVFFQVIGEREKK